jgi:hypothetical protein
MPSYEMIYGAAGQRHRRIKAFRNGHEIGKLLGSGYVVWPVPSLDGGRVSRIERGP